MIWEIEIQPLLSDLEKKRVNGEFHLLMSGKRNQEMVSFTTRGFLLQGDLTREAAEKLKTELLVDAVVEKATLQQVGCQQKERSGDPCLATVLLKPGVMDPTALSIIAASKDLGVPVQGVRSFRRYFGPPPAAQDKAVLFRRVLANDAIEMIVEGQLQDHHLGRGTEYKF
ncbi:MAG: phosphoribosylformylglycinamidine synthase, partial [Planctomycetia bacterium]